MSVRFISEGRFKENERGVAAVGDYRFAFHKLLIGGVDRWRCCERIRFACNSYLKTRAGELVEMSPHNHEPSRRFSLAATSEKRLLNVNPDSSERANKMVKSETNNDENGRVCVARGCPVSSASHPNETLFRFPPPSDRHRFRHWCKVVRCDIVNYHTRPFLCHRHFREKDFCDRNTRKELTFGANPWYPTEQLDENTHRYGPAVFTRQGLKHIRRQKREPLYLPSEKELLAQLMEAHFDKIECSNAINGQSKMSKLLAWKAIEEEFNLSSSVRYRDAITLKHLWENLKKKAKIVIAEQQDNTSASGGGKAKEILKDPIIPRVMALFCRRVEPLQNEVDYKDIYDEDIYDYDDHIQMDEVVIDGSVVVDNDANYDDDDDDDDDYVNNANEEEIESYKETTAANEFLNENPTKLKASNPTLPCKSHSPTSPRVVTQGSCASISRTTLTADISRKRAALKKPVELQSPKKTFLSKANNDTSTQQAIQISILELQLAQEKEKLIQEKIKTALLMKQLRDSGMSCEFIEE